MIDRIQSDLKGAMKSGDGTAVSTLRMILSAINYAKIQEKRDLNEDEIIAQFRKGIRTRQESIEAFRKGGRDDLAAKEAAEIVVLQRYVPSLMMGADLDQAVEALLRETGITEKKDLGRAMKEFLERHRGKADGKAVHAAIAARLK